MLTEKKQSYFEFLPFLTKVENVLATERQRCRARTKENNLKAYMTNGNEIAGDAIGDNNAFDIFNK